MTTAPTSAPAASDPLLVVNGIEVIYNHVILVLKGVSLQVPRESIVAILGGNGAGKTTSIGKLTRHLADEGQSVLLAAADTFRAAAREQLGVWANRNTVEIVSQ
ncbi:ATP-binding cassette domain-containing protein, partial [Pseudomonas aeruginosa]